MAAISPLSVAPLTSVRTVQPSASAANNQHLFSELLQKTSAAQENKHESLKNSAKQGLSAPGDKNQKNDRSTDASAAALALLTPVQPQAIPVESRSWSLSLPKKGPAASEISKSEAAGAQSETEKVSNSEPPLAPQIISKQQIAFGATLLKTDDAPHTHSHAGPAEPTAPGKLSAVENKPDSGKQHPGNGSSSDDSHQEKQPAAAPAGNGIASTQVHAASPSPGVTAATVPIPGAAASLHGSAAAYTMPAPKAVAAAAAPRTAEVIEPQASAAPRPASIDLQTGDVTVRVSQRAGDVQITVRTGDNNMAQSLRQHLPELADKLTQTGVHADLWQPSTAKSSMSGEGGDASPDQGGSNQHYSGPQDEGNDPQQQSEQERQKAWRQELSSADGSDR